jgi:hypothetical protein
LLVALLAWRLMDFLVASAARGLLDLLVALAALLVLPVPAVVVRSGIGSSIRCVTSMGSDAGRSRAALVDRRNRVPLEQPDECSLSQLHHPFGLRVLG